MKYLIAILIAILLSFIPNFGVIAFISFAIGATIHEIYENNRIHSLSSSLDIDLQRFRDLKTEYMRSSIWNIKRKEVLKRDNYTCQICKSTITSLSVHHMKDYRLIPNEPISSLVTLCQPCHDNEHTCSDNKLITLDDYYTWNQPISPKS